MIIKQMEHNNNKKKGIIYKIEFGDYLYIGSTKQKYLSTRQGNHNFRLRENKRQNFLYKKCRELGIEKIECNFIKNFYYDTIEELVQEEEKYRIMLNANLNSKICYVKLTNEEYRKEYYLKNKNDILNVNKNYRDKNIDKIKEQKKEYYETNKDKKKEYYKEYYKNKILERKEYYKNNKNKYNELYKSNYIKNGSVICDNCGSSIIKSNLKRHKTSKKCLNYNKNE